MNNYYNKFKVYNHTLVINDQQLITRKFIVLECKDNSLQFTDFHKYVMSPYNKVKRISSNGNNRFDFVVKFLNYIFFYKEINTMDKLTIDIVKEYLNDYGKGILPNDTQGRTKSTVERCINYIMDFLTLYFEANPSPNFKIKDLYKEVPYRDKRGKIKTKKVPVFEVFYNSKDKPIFRDIPNDAFEYLFEYVATYHKELLGLISLSAFAGLRPAEACNVRREDSPLGPGIRFTYYDNEIQKIQIDLSEEKCLRSDLKSTGDIKKERIQNVPYIFLDAFTDSYNNYMSYMNGKKYEADYGAFTVNKQGKAMTYDSYYQKFTSMIKNELRPLFLKSDNPEIVQFGQLLIEHNLSPHVFRHWYTVQLVLSGVDNVAELMAARGDSSPESCLVYLQNKGELEKKYRRLNNEMFNYLTWASNKKMNH